MAELRILRFTDPDFASRLEELRTLLHSVGVLAQTSELNVPERVRSILEEVRTGGDQSVVRLVNELDRATLSASDLRVPDAQLTQALDSAEPEFIALMRRAASNIRAYQEHILHRPPPQLERDGRKLGIRYTPIDRVGVYVPGGQALYPSTVLMTVVPAQVAGVREIALYSPPTHGDINPMALAVAAMLGVTEVYRVGGAVAIAAAAYGTESIRAVDKIVGPGNAFVAEAKRQLFGKVGIDSIAGPSEVLIVADDSANPQYVAADLLAQAEHAPGSAVLVTTSQELAARVQREVTEQVRLLSREAEISMALDRYSAAVVVGSFEAAIDLANTFAAEHLQLMTRDNERCLAEIRHAGAIFIGDHTPVPLGDYFAGPSHVLPTSGTARFFQPLSCNDFRKSSSVIEYERAALEQDAEDVANFATREGLSAHARAVTIR
jgi:histidinol dehydrogenase